ncbi:MAG: MFS transporter [Anaerolineae bacterium]
MHSEPTTVDKLRALPWSIASNAAQSVYLQLTFFGSVFVLFLSSLGLDNVQIGFLLSLLPFTGILSLALAPAIARVGYKRTWLTFFGLRTFITAFLLLTPWVVERFGSEAAMGFITAVVLVYALVRTVGVSAGFPWIQEYVPNSVRGKYTASNNFYSTIAGFIAVTTAGLVLERTIGLTGYMVLIAIGVLFGFISVALASRIPGGAPVKPDKSKPAPPRDIKDALRDSDMLRYLAGVGLFTLATVPLGAFLPLFMRDQVGLSTSQVVLLQTGAMVGALVSSYFWGWASDRYGGRPVTLYGLAFRALLPVFWMLLPGMGSAALPAANAIAVFQGFADVGWQVGATRLLYVSIVPHGQARRLHGGLLGLAGTDQRFQPVVRRLAADRHRESVGQRWRVSRWIPTRRFFCWASSCPSRRSSCCAAFAMTPPSAWAALPAFSCVAILFWRWRQWCAFTWPRTRRPRCGSPSS